jgi:hypothetical protein
MNIVNIRIELSNPFDRREFFKNLGCLSGKITKRLAWELEHSYLSTMLLDTDIRWTRGTDHAGIDIRIGILGYGIGFRIYDTRHWNYDTDSWEIYNV